MTAEEKSTLSPVVIDGSLYFLVAVGSAFGACLSSDEAAKFLSPTVLFWLRTVAASLTAGLLAVKMFRSTAYAAFVEKKKSDTVFFSKPKPSQDPQ